MTNHIICLDNGSQSSCHWTSTVTWRPMKRHGVISNARPTRTRRGMRPSSKCADTRYSFALPAFDGMWDTYSTVRVKFADLSEYGYGVAILSESKYGFSCQGNVLRISLLRAATAPDAEQDQGSSCISPLPWDDDGSYCFSHRQA
jgi:hypothetical protein